MKRLCIFIFLSIPSLLFAQTPLTLEECIALAKENSKTMAVARLQESVARHERRSAFANFLPVFSVEGGGLYSTVDGALDVEGGMLPVLGVDGMPTGASAYFPGLSLGYDVDWVWNAGVKFQQPLFMGGKIVTGYRMSRVGESMARQNSRLAEAELVVAVAEAYANALRAAELKKIALAYNELLVELLRSVKKATERGAKTRNDVLKVEVKLNESELSLRRAENGSRLAMMNLCHYLGYPLSQQIEVCGELPESDSPATLSADISLRPEAQMLAGKSELVRLNVNMARAEMLPQVAVMGQYGYMNGIELAGRNMLDDWNFTAGVQVSIPIKFGADSKYRSARVQYHIAQAEREDKMELMSLEAVQAANNLDEAGLELRLAELAVVSANENLRVSRKQYEASVELLSDYLEAQLLWQQAEQGLVDARIGCFLRLIEYRKATGNID